MASKKHFLLDPKTKNHPILIHNKPKYKNIIDNLKPNKEDIKIYNRKKSRRNNTKKLNNKKSRKNKN